MVNLAGKFAGEDRWYLTPNPLCVSWSLKSGRMVTVPASERFFSAGVNLSPGQVFKFGDRGPHTSRTMMLADLSSVLAAVPAAGDAEAYSRAVLEDNVTDKPTAATRRATLQRLSELYGLRPDLMSFRALRYLWDQDHPARPKIALCCALARDPRLRMTAPFVRDLAAGADLQREAMKDAVRARAGGRLNEDTLDKVVRNASSTWVQAGHLIGRTFKRRRTVIATPGAAAYAAYIAYLAGFRGREMFECDWFRVLDLRPERAIDLLQDARRRGLIEFQSSGDIVSIGFDRLEADPRSA